MSEENNNPHEADLLDAMTLSPAKKAGIYCRRRLSQTG